MVCRYWYYCARQQAVFFAAAWGCTAAFGSVGFIVANCINMFVRIVQSYWFIGSYGTPKKAEKEARGPHPLLAALPAPAMFGAFGASLLVTMISKTQLCCDGFGWSHKLLHMAVAVLMLCVCGTALYLTERAFIRDLQNLFRGGKKTQ